MAALEFITRTDISGTYDSTWRSYDCTTLIAGLSDITTASGVLLEYEWSATTSSDDIGFRRGDSTDTDVWQTSAQTGVRQVAIGLDSADDTFDYYADSGAGVPSIFIIGFFNDDDVKFLQNTTNFTPGNGTYADANIASATGGDTAIAGIFHHLSDRTNLINWAWRKKGTSEDTIYGELSNTSESGDGLIICGCDGSEVCEFKQSSSFGGDSAALVGYFISGITWKDTATDISEGTTGSYQPADITPTDAFAAYVVSFNVGVTTEEGFGVRKDSGGNDGYGDVAQITTHLVEIGAGDTIEQHIEATTRDLYLRATIDAAGGSTTQGLSQQGTYGMNIMTGGFK